MSYVGVVWLGQAATDARDLDGSRGGGFTYAAFHGVTTQEVTAIQLDGVGHYVAQEAPHLLTDRLLEVLAANAPSTLNERQ